MVERQVSTQLVSPKEFTLLWNLLLVKSKKVIAQGETFPITVLALKEENDMLRKISFVVERVNADSDFLQELCMSTRERVYFSITCENSQIQIDANRIEERSHN